MRIINNRWISKVEIFGMSGIMVFTGKIQGEKKT